MKLIARICTCFLWLASACLAAPKPHSVSFGKWTSIRLSDENEDKQIDVKIRPLLVDGQMKEFTSGQPHDVTERTFVVQRVHRMNNSLPQETGAIRWSWERGGWLLVDRRSGKVQAVVLPAFDAHYSDVNWFRDYAAYCGISDDGQKPFAVVAQLGRRKPLLKKSLTDPGDGKDIGCAPAIWQRGPARVTFDPKNEAKFTYGVRSRTVDVSSSDESEGEE